jgi:transposase InsO family protein
MSATIEASGQGLAELIAIARAAHLARDREMKSAAVRRLREEYGVTITFQRPSNEQNGGRSC